jgi:hypothetical protein
MPITIAFPITKPKSFPESLAQSLTITQPQPKSIS